MTETEAFMNNCKIRCCSVLLLGLVLSSTAWAQWPSDPMLNLALADGTNDQVQPKLLPLSNGGWYLTWFNNNPNGNPPFGYDVYVQALDAGGVELGPHNGIRVADLGLSSTQDYGMDVDTAGNGLVAFLDDREGTNEQVTAAKISRGGTLLWGKLGIQLTNDDSSFHGNPKIAGTSDGNVVVGWINDSSVVLQKLDSNGNPLWGSGVVLKESRANYSLADLHASDNGSVIISWVRDTGFSSPKTLQATKLSAAGKPLWGNSPLQIYDAGSLQFGEFPYFVPDGSGGAVFSWYSSSPSLQVFAQHILANGSEAFPHNGSPGSNNANNVRVSPSVSYRPSTGETFLFWTEEDSNQFTNGVYGQKFDSVGTQKWGSNGLAIVPLGSDQQLFVQNVPSGDGALVFWVDESGFGSDIMNAVHLDAAGHQTCPPFPVSSLSSGKSRLAANIAASGQAAVVWEDSRSGDQNIFIQDVNPDCSLGYPDLQCSDLSGARARCENGTLKVAIGLRDKSHDGDSLTLQVNGVDQPMPVHGAHAELSVPGQGKNTLLLEKPAGCISQKVVQCP